MIVSSLVPAQNGMAAPLHAAKPRPVLRMVAHERMGGSVPVWEVPGSARDQMLGRLETIQSGRRFDDVLNDALAYAPGAKPASIEEEPFGFADLVDIINPLHHIPVVGTLYREITGDSIRASGRIVGGAVFGGGLGAAAGVANTIIEHETGNSLEGHVMAAVRGADGFVHAAPAQAQTIETLASLHQPRLSSAMQMSFVADAPAAAQPRAQVQYKFNE